MTSAADRTPHRPTVRPYGGEPARGAAGLLAGILGLAVADLVLDGLTIDGDLATLVGRLAGTEVAASTAYTEGSARLEAAAAGSVAGRPGRCWSGPPTSHLRSGASSVPMPCTASWSAGWSTWATGRNCGPRW